MKLNVLKVLAVGVAVVGVGVASTLTVNAAEWKARTVDQIKADIAKTNGKEYTIVWGDTLSAISGATNITVQKLADMNKIANVDLIYAGNTLVFEGNVATVQNNKGETVAQSVIKPQDKVDSTKPVGQPATSQGTTSNNTTNSATQNTTTPSTGNTVTGNTQASGQTTGNAGTTATSGKADTNSQGTSASSSGTNGSQNGTNSSTGETVAPGNVETPAQPSKPATPSQPADNQPIQPSKGEDQGGSTKPTTLDTTPINMGNSGKVFDSEEAASEYGYAEIANEKSPWYGYRFGASQLVNKDYELLGTWTVDFTENKRFDWNN